MDRSGVWFGKSMPHNYQLLRHYTNSQPSRHKFVRGCLAKMIAHAIESETRSRVAGSISAHLLAVLNGARMLRA